MSIFTNADFSPLAEEIIRDSFYSDNSYAGKIGAERRFAELVVRKALDLPLGSQMTLGEKQIKAQIALLPHHVLLENAIKGLKPFGNVNSHTYGTTVATEADYEKATECLMDMYAYLPVRYFDKYKFGSRDDVVSAFSLLPPVVRYKTLDFLYSVDSQNISVIDKLVLVVLKEKGYEKAKEWLDNHKGDLESLKVISDETYKRIKEKQGEQMAKMIEESAPPNMYVCCKSKIEELKTSLDGKSMYRTFEEAYPYYKQYGIIPDDGSSDVKEFNDLMEFLYLGRKAENINKLDEPFFVINMIKWIVDRRLDF